MTTPIITPRRRAGQPPKGENARSKVLSTRVTPHLMRRINACASLEGIPVSAWLVAVCERQAAQILREDVTP